jgi:hypothetical protein
MMMDPMQRTDGIALETKDHTANEKFFKPGRTPSSIFMPKKNNHEYVVNGMCWIYLKMICRYVGRPQVWLALRRRDLVALRSASLNNAGWGL